VLVTRKSIASDKEEFLLKYHDHITIVSVVPHVSTLSPVFDAVSQADVGVRNNLQPAKLYGADGCLIPEPDTSQISEADAISKTEEVLKGGALTRDPITLGPQGTTSFTIYGVLTKDEMKQLMDRKAVLYAVGLVVFKDETGVYEQPFCNAITIRTLPGGNTTSYDLRCHNFNDETERNPKQTTYR
jgi:hypothetical protein